MHYMQRNCSKAALSEGGHRVIFDLDPKAPTFEPTAIGELSMATRMCEQVVC